MNMSRRGIWTLATVCLLIGSFIIIADNSQACFSWEVTVEDDDTANGVDEGYYTTYRIIVSMRPGCRDTYWLSFWVDETIPDWSSAIIDMEGEQIHYYGDPNFEEFVLSGTVTYIFTFKVMADESISITEPASMTLNIKADDKYNEEETITETFITTCYGLLDYTPEKPVLTQLENTTNSIKLGWTECTEGDFDRYEIHMGKSADFTPVENTLVHTITNPTETDYNLTGLSNGSSYYFIVQVWDDDANGPFFADSNTLLAYTPGVNYPPVPVVLEPPTEISNRSVRLTWSQNMDEDFDCYEIHRGYSPGFPLNQSTRFGDPIYDQSTVTKVVEGLYENRTQYFRIRVWDHGGASNVSNEVYCTTLDNWPNPVHLFDPYDTETDKTELYWTQNEDTDFDRYEIHKSETQGFKPGQDTCCGNITDTKNNFTTVIGLAEKTTYYFRIMVYDQAGHYSTSNEESTTTLDETAPTILDNIPDDNALDVDIDEDVIITFDEEMDESSLTYTCSPDPCNWNAVWNTAGDMVTLNHDDFDDETQYTFTITGANDTSGNPMASNFVLSFTTRDLTPPEITNTDPADDAEDVWVTSDISFTFSEPMDQGSVEGAISTSINYGKPQWSGNTMTLSPTSDLLYSRSYTVTIGTGATDAAGNALAPSFTLNFKTEEADVNHPPEVSVQSPSSDIADETFTIEWSASDVDDDTISISLYYDTDKNTNNGMTLIQSSLSNSGSYVWDTSSLDEGNYFIYALANDGDLEAGAYSGLLTIDHPDITEIDTDDDGIPDATDSDDDNDGVPDTLEDRDGDGELDSDETDPLDPDTDGDGYDDDVDEFPRDPVRWVAESKDESDESSLPLVLIMIVVIAIIVAVVIAAWAITSGKKGGVPGGTINCPTCNQPFAPDPTSLPYVQCPHCGTQGRMK